jgi:hypothetical protein
MAALAIAGPLTCVILLAGGDQVDSVPSADAAGTDTVCCIQSLPVLTAEVRKIQLIEALSRLDW